MPDTSGRLPGFGPGGGTFPATPGIAQVSPPPGLSPGDIIGLILGGPATMIPGAQALAASGPNGGLLLQAEQFALTFAGYIATNLLVILFAGLGLYLLFGPEVRAATAYVNTQLDSAAKVAEVAA